MENKTYEEVIRGIKAITPNAELGKLTLLESFESCTRGCREEMEELFEFAQRNFEMVIGTWYPDASLKCYFAYSQNDTPNACAGVIDDCGIIIFNKGLISQTMLYFKENLDILNGNPDYQALDGELEANKTGKEAGKFHILMHQTALHFVFYHELAHIVQKMNEKKYNDFWEESNDDTTAHNENRHIAELDADTCSAYFLVEHFEKYIEKIKSNDLKNKLIVAMIGAVCIHILSFAGNLNKLTFQGGTHPHPIIRFWWILAALKTTIKAHNKIKIDLVKKDITLQDVLSFCESIFTHENIPLSSDFFKNAKQLSPADGNRLEKRAIKLFEAVKQNKDSAHNKWNN